jgi:hypothetical protein
VTRLVKGTTLKVSAAHLQEKKLLGIHGYRVEEVYTSGSLTFNRLVLLLSFSGIFLFLTMAFGFTALSPR